MINDDSQFSIPEEDTSFAHNMSRSFSARKEKNRPTQQQCPNSNLPSIIRNTHTNHTVTPKFTTSPPLVFRKARTLVIQRKDSVSPERRGDNETIFENISLSKLKSMTIQDKEDRSELASPARLASRHNSEVSSIRKSFMRGESFAVSPTGKDEGLDVFGDEEKTKHEAMKSKKKIFFEKMLNSNLSHLVVGVFTVYALFADDVRFLVDIRTVDLAFDILSIVSFCLFVAEICITWYVEKDYMCSFFFWLDLISTLSLVFDVEFLLEDLFPAEANDSAQIAEASRASRIATKQGRIIRIVRLVQLAKLYKEVNITHGTVAIRERPNTKIYPEPKIEISPPAEPSQALNQIQEHSALTTHILPSRMESELTNQIKQEIEIKPVIKPQKVQNDSEESKKNYLVHRSQTLKQAELMDLKNPRELRVGKKLTDLTTKRVIVIVLALLVLIPLFSSDFYFEDSDSQKYQMDLIARLIDNPNVTEAAVRAAINEFISQHRENSPHIMYFRMGDEVIFIEPGVDLSHLKHSLTEKVSIFTSKGEIISITNTAEESKLDGGLGLGRILFVCCALTFGAILVSKDANDLLLYPLEKIIRRVNKFARNPLLYKEQEAIKDNEFANETVQLENAIMKIGKLLAVGYGEAGASIITQNISDDGDLRSVFAGKKTIAIFGFCDILNFAEITEVLQEEIMVFVNSIADIVHSIGDKYIGAVSKNTGEGFLLVWKLPEDTITEFEDGYLEVLDERIVQNVADCALISFLKIYARINRDPTLNEYRRKFTEKGYNYHVNMGFGLHVGWAIEGAIGSDYKIDASYMSPHVNIATYLKDATNHFGAPLLFSGDMYELISDVLKEKARLIDVIAVKGSTKPIDLYTIDMDMDIEEIRPSKARRNSYKAQRKLKNIQKKEKLIDMIEDGEIYTLVGRDKELRYIFKNYDKKYNELFNHAMNEYQAGNWPAAKEKLEECLKMRSQDRPAKMLLDMMKENGYVSPVGWAGYHNMD